MLALILSHGPHVSNDTGNLISGVWYLGQNTIVTASIDQRICVWCLTVQDSKIEVIVSHYGTTIIINPFISK